MPFIYTDILYNIFSAPVHCIIEHYFWKKNLKLQISYFIILYQNQRSKKKRPIGFWLHSDK